MRTEFFNSNPYSNVNSTEDKKNPKQSLPTLGNYMGRFVEWLNKTPEGCFTKGIGYLVGAAVVGTGALVVFKAAIITAFVSALLSVTVIGIPYALIGFGFAGGLIAFTSEIFKLAGSCLALAAEHFKKVNHYNNLD